MAKFPDVEVDIVIAGFGAAGSAAALRAAQLGASVLIVEKQAQDHHTPSIKMSTGFVMSVADSKAAARYLDNCAGGTVPFSISEAWARKAVDLIDWLNSDLVDVRLHTASKGAEHPEMDDAESVVVFDPPLGGGFELFGKLATAVARRPEITVRWESPAKRLVQDKDGKVIGLMVEGPEAGRIIARKGVVLATGGFEFDNEFKVNYLKAPDIHFYSNPGNTGDGIRMAQAVGADLWRMNGMVGRAVAHFVTEEGQSININPPMTPGGYVLLDCDGRRFTNEAHQAESRHDFYYSLLQYDSDRGIYPRIPCYWFFDAKRLRVPIADPLKGVGVVNIYNWSRDNFKEIERGWIIAGDSLEDVAMKADLDPKAVTESIEQYNEDCRLLSDPFGRPPMTLLPIDEGPFGCIKMYPGGANSSGGPRRNHRAEVLDPFGEKIDGLYSAGEMGQPIGLLYPAWGADICEAMCSGQIAVESALQ